MQSRTYGLILALVLACACGPAWADDALIPWSGTKFDCKVIRLTSDGRVLFKAPYLNGELRGVMSQIATIDLQSKAKPDADKAGVRLVNGDMLLGEIVAVGAEKLVLKSKTLGRVEIPRSAVAEVISRAPSLLHEIDFRHVNAAKPWFPVRGVARISAGAVQREGIGTLSLAMKQKSALTMEVVLVANELDSKLNMPFVSLSLFASGIKGRPDTGSVQMNLYGTGRKAPGVRFVSMCNGDRNWQKLRGDTRQGTPFKWRVVDNVQSRSVRIAFDPGTREMMCWIEGRLTRKQKLKGRLPQGGDFIRIHTAMGKIGIQSVRILSGVAPPLEVTLAEGEDKTDVVVMNDGQRHMAESVVLSPQGYVLRTEAGEKRLDPEHVARILFARGKRKALPHVNGDLRVEAGESILTLQGAELTATSLTGTSATIGPVKIDRANVRLIQGIAAVPDEFPAAKPSPAMLHFKSGAALPCRIDGIDPDGKVRFEAPLIDGAASAPFAHVKRLAMTNAAEDASALAVVLTNGDRVAGDLVDLSEQDEIVVETPAAGEVEVPRKLIRCLIATSGDPGAVWSDFTSGGMEPWQVRERRPVMKDGALQATTPSYVGSDSVMVRMKQDGPTTIQAVLARGKVQTGVTLWLHARKGSDGNYLSGIRTRFLSNIGIVDLWANGGMVEVGRTPEPENAVDEKIMKCTVSFDPDSGEIKVWIGEEFLRTLNADCVMPDGEEVAIDLMPGTRVLRARARPGIHPPVEGDEFPADKGRVVLRNGDIVVATATLDVADGVLLVPTVGGQLRCPFEKIARIDLPVRKLAKPVRKRTDARVHVGHSILTMQVTEMTETTLRGRSDYLGELRLPRKLVRSVEF